MSQSPSGIHAGSVFCRKTGNSLLYFADSVVFWLLAFRYNDTVQRKTRKKEGNMNKKDNDRIYRVLIPAVLIAIAAVILLGTVGHRKTPEVPQRVSVTPPSVKVEYVEKEKVVEVTKEVSAQTIQDGLRDMGVLITREYYFTEVADYSSNLSFRLWKSEVVLPGSESSFLVSYDGIVSAGIDFGAVTVTRDEETGQITVGIPKAVIRSIDIDPDSFQLHSETQSILNPVSVEDYNSSLLELEKTARENALSRGLLERADENARTIIGNFILGITQTDPVNVTYITI